MKAFLLLLLFCCTLKGAGLGVYNPAQHAINGFMPTQLPGLVIWLDAGRQGYTNGTSVAVIKDFSGNGYNATNGTGSKQPLITNGRFNGRDGIQFDGVDDFLVSGNVLGLSNRTCLNVYYAINPKNTIVPDGIAIDRRWQFGDYNSGKHIFVSESSGVFSGETVLLLIAKNGTLGRIGSTNHSYLANIPFLEGEELTSSGTRFFSNGSEIPLTLTNLITTSSDSSPLATGYTADNDIVIGAGYNNKPTVAGFTDARISEFVATTVPLTQHQRAQLQRYLGTKYGIVVK